MLKVGIIGASGYTGAELIRVLSCHPKVAISVITSRQYAGKPLGDCYPGLSHLGLSFEATGDDADFSKAELYFTALPHKAAMDAAAKILAAGAKVVDLSADFRLSDKAVYEAHYGPHGYPELLAEAVYGLAEVNREAIARARLVANPGCYPTSALLPLIPLARKGLISLDGIIIDAKSGVSGAGREATETTHFCGADESVKAYKVASHRHTPEIEEHLGKAAGGEVRLVFTPHLMPMKRGMLSTIYCTPLNGAGRKEVEAAWREAYEGSPFVSLAHGETLPDTALVAGTNRCVMAAREDKRCGRLILLSVIDNLAKGASTQAVQNMNIMLGWNEKLGLPLEPLFP